uniref:DHHA1 domain-containing protein n=1 Tax=Craspedostauros australis TaxID=1486917 RepID=A0A7R9WUI9_9STRA
MSEQGIAKGIRRMVFVTREKAKAAIAAAEAFEVKLTAAEAVEGANLEKEVKTLTAELDALVISAVRKNDFRATLQKMSKKAVAWKKERLAGMTGEIKQGAIAAGEASEGNKVVYRFDFGIDGKLAKSVTQAFTKKIKDKALMLVSADEAADRFMVMAVAAKGLDIDCKQWVTTSCEGTGGKGGGKKDSCQFTVPGVSHVDAVMEKAKKY